MPKLPDKSVIAGLRGHVSTAERAARTEAAERQRATGILTERSVAGGDWSAAKTLMTTLGGKMRPLTPDDLATFRRNMTLARRNFGGYSGITAAEVIDLAGGHALAYRTRQPGGARSDIDKARSEIKIALPVSALGDLVRFRTSSSRGSDVPHHTVIVRFMGFRDAQQRIIAAGPDKSGPRKAASWMRKERLAFDCDCKRHRYFLRYVATIGGFNAGRDETGFPKIRNPGLQGVACKHVLRVMAELQSSNIVLGFLERHLARVSQALRATQVTKAEAADMQARRRGRASPIRTSEERAAAARAAKVRESAVAAATRAAATPPKRVAPATRRLTSGQTDAIALFAKQFNMSEADVLKLVAKR
jgi:hypothetical protein